jgi:hypothetical protein
MANHKIGTLGLSIPVINPSNVPKLKMTPAEVIKWRSALPMADTGTAAKKLYMALSDLNSTSLEPKDRFEIIELFRSTNRTICSTLKKHYIEQSEPLNAQKLTIATLRQTLISEMADNYKLILEGLYEKKNKSEEDQKMITTTICRILYYLDMVLLCRYQLYSAVPENIWKEVHLLYKYAKKNNTLNEQVACELSLNSTTSAIASYTRIILLSATDPYQWRQRDQYSIDKAIDLWAVYPTIYESSQIPADKKTGIYIIDLEKDQPPVALSFKRDPITSSCIGLDLAKNVKHLKHLLLKIHNNELQAKIEHPGDHEFSVTIPTINKLIKIWSQQISRNTQRFPITAKIKVVFGLTAAHYYINHEQEFNSRPSHLMVTTVTRPAGSFNRPTLDMPIFEIEDDEELDVPSRMAMVAKQNQENNPDKAATGGETPVTTDDKLPEIDREHHYIVYDYNIENISPNGFCILIDDGTFPPFQAGEIMAFKNPLEDANAPWSIGTVRWIRSPGQGKFQIGIELVAPFAKAAGLQMLRDNQPVGLLLRCLVLPEAPDLNSPAMIITPTFPLRSNKVMLYLDNDEKGIRTTLTRELEATGSYHQYLYSTKENINIVDPKVEDAHKPAETVTEQSMSDIDEDQVSTEFDSIWKDL